MATKRTKQRVIFEETPEIIEKLKILADRMGLSVAGVIRMAVRSYLEDSTLGER